MRLPSLLLCFVTLLLVPQRAHAMDDLDRRRAQASFERGQSLYGAGDYAGAAREFQAAAALVPRPELDYDLARCYDQLGQVGPAISAYERYLAWGADDPDVPDVRKRVAVLRGRRDASRAIIAPIAVGALAVVSGVVGAALVGTAPSRYDHFASTCAPRCDQGAVDRARGMDYAGQAALALGGALLVVDVILWATHKGRVERLRGASVKPLATSAR